MRIIPFLLSLAITTGLVLALHHRWDVGGNRTPRLGHFLSPQTGFWQNAEPHDATFNLELQTAQLREEVDVYLDDRLVPHVFAQNEHDVFFVQGYLHARFRLWQMEFQVDAAAGRLAERVGRMKGSYDILEKKDRLFRRLGMGLAAENALKAIEAHPDTKAVLDAYTAGINHYISHLRPEAYPVEYKLLDYAPERWTNLKTALFLKYMSYDLAGYESDFEHTHAMSFLNRRQYRQAYPYGIDSLDPIIPHDTAFGPPGVPVQLPASAATDYFHFAHDTLRQVPEKPNPLNGSNNWAIAGSKTASGSAILCGDPHLGLNLPSLWFEIQLHTPNWNAYGASFPGAPAIAIGFNDSIGWSETNAMRDVRDYYEIRFRDASQQEYRFNNAWVKTAWRFDTIKVAGGPDFIDSIPLTVFGPVMYDQRYANPLQNGKAYAVRWKAHDASNELQTFVKLCRARNYDDYLDAIKTFECPGQNFAFAAKNGDIAMWNQGAFPARWRRQGDFLMPGTDSTYLWQGMIPQAENPHERNPARGFVSSANQMPVDTTYPYYLSGNFDYYRGMIINRLLRSMNGITVADMQQMQTSEYNFLARTALPLLLKQLPDSILVSTERKAADSLRNWNFENNAALIGPTLFTYLMRNLNQLVWQDEFSAGNQAVVQMPWQATLVDALLKDSAFSFIDDITTPQKETLPDLVHQALAQTVQQLDSMAASGGGDITWGRVNDVQVNHLLRLTPFSRLHLGIGGGSNVISASHDNHGPSWRMIVHFTAQTEAWAVYPGGQSGNPGSPYYDLFVDTWAAGKYYPLWIMKEAEKNDRKVKWKIHFSPGA